MKDGRWGRIVNFGSGSVFHGVALSPYGKLLGTAGSSLPLLRRGPGSVTAGSAG